MDNIFDPFIICIFGQESGDIVGTGFLVSECHVLTCAHVVVEALDPMENSKDYLTKEVLSK